MSNNPFHSSSTTRAERQLKESNRRKEMKALFTTLNSLLPHQNSMEGKTMSDQVENATNYIKETQEKLEILKEKKEKLIMKIMEEEIKPKSLVEVKVHKVGSSMMEVILVTGSDYHFLFTQILHILQQNGAQILNVNQTMFAVDRFLHKIIAQVDGEGMTPEEDDGERVCKKVQKFVSQYKDGQ